MQHHAADQLHIEVAHVEHAAAGFADYRKGFDQNFVEHFLQSFVFLLFELLLLVEVRFLLGFGTAAGSGAVWRAGSAAPGCAGGIRRSWRALASVSFCISGSSALMACTFGISALISRSFLVPKTLPNSVLIKPEVLQRAADAQLPL